MRVEIWTVNPNGSLTLQGWRDSRVDGVFHEVPARNKYSIAVENLDPFRDVMPNGQMFNELLKDYAVTNLSDMDYAENWISPLGNNPATGTPRTWTANQFYSGQSGANFSIIASHGHPTFGSIDASTTLFAHEIYAENYFTQRASQVGSGNTPYNSGAIQMNHLMLLNCYVGNYIGWSNAINPGNVGGQNQSVLACKQPLSLGGMFRFSSEYLVKLSEGKSVQRSLEEMVEDFRADFDDGKLEGQIIASGVDSNGRASGFTRSDYAHFVVFGDKATMMRNVYLGNFQEQSTTWWRRLA